jgi:shikimate kinase
MSIPADKRLLFLIGPRGSGKTTVARLLAERLGWSWCDTDTLLEGRAGKTIRQVFEQEGEAGFRDRESAILQEIATWCDHVIATGGGVVLRPDNRVLLRRGLVVWLRAAPEVLWQRMQTDATSLERRPNLNQGGLAEVEAVLHARASLYDACADYQIDTDLRSPEEIANQIIAEIL